MELANETIAELHNAPECDYAKLDTLSKKYLEKVSQVNVALGENVSLIQPYRPYGQNNYALRRNVEVTEALNRLSTEFKDLY